MAIFKKLQEAILNIENENSIIRKTFPQEINKELIFGKQLVLDDLGLTEEQNLLVKGGKADHLSIADIAAKHNITAEKLQIQIDKGIKIEKEHTDDQEIAKEIAMDHLSEFPDYYDRLDKMEEEAKKDLKEENESSMAGVAGIVGIEPGDHGEAADINTEELNNLNEMVKEVDGKWYVYNHDGTKKLSNGYMSENQAKQRLHAIEWFKEKNKKA